MSPGCGNMLGAVEGAAVDGEKKSPEEEEKYPLEEEKRGGTHIDQDGKTQVSIEAVEPTSEHLSYGVEQEHLMDIAEEEDNSEKVQPHEKKQKKRKKSELQQIKQEKRLIDPEKTPLTVDGHQPHLPCGVQQEHLMAVAEDDLEKVQLQEKKVKKRRRSELKKIKEEKLLSDAAEPASKAPCPLRWCVSYSTLLMKNHKVQYEGSILLDPTVNRVTLLDVNETTVDACYLKEGDIISPGWVFWFPCHKSEIVEQILEVEEQGKENVINLKRNKVDKLDEKKRNKLKRKRSDESGRRNKQPLESPQARLVGSSLGKFARVATLRKRMSPQVQDNVTVHFPSPNLPRVGSCLFG